jgi:hypothetical protein
MKKINVSIAPKLGYFFTEKDGTTIHGTGNWASVIARVASYRKRNRLAPGNPRAEVTAQACEREPNTCHDTPDAATQKALKVASLKGRVLAWLSGLRARRDAGSLPFVEESLMHARVAVCAGCPAHAAIAGGCGSCKKAVTESRRDILGGRKIDDRVAGCTILGEDCAVNAWLGDPTLVNAELPACCWRKIS